MSAVDAAVVITGAGSGIGFALAQGFLGDGASVVACDVDGEGMAPLAEKGARTVVGDVSHEADVARMLDAALDGWGRLDVLINNAGVGVQKTIEELGPDEYERVLRVNLFGPYYGIRTALPMMRAQGRGRIINVISRHAEFTPAGLAGYSSSKAALWALTRTAANEVRDADILVNALIPGPTATKMNPAGTQSPDAVYPTAHMLATLPAGGPNGKCFWDMEEYLMYQAEKRPRRG